MALVLKAKNMAELVLRAKTAADLMTPNPVSIHEGASLQEAVAMFADKGFNAAPAIDAAGRPVGVLSRYDIVVHDRERVDYVPADASNDHERDIRTPAGERLGRGFQVARVDKTRVRDVMTPVIFSVAPDVPAAKVIRELLDLNVHRLFVVDHSGVLVGVISTVDILRHLTV